MTDPSRYAVPLDALDQVRVDATEQVEEQDASPAAAAWGGALVPPHADGAGGDCDGD